MRRLAASTLALLALVAASCGGASSDSDIEAGGLPSPAPPPDEVTDIDELLGGFFD